ncbi:hypothetical protein GCM10017567_45130 [Amycolatopsis bullii]|uniref:Phosphoserine phosphatase n=1 Tax=Amycolatopsis bullii TaxID=941987 RepID=A0ABQ3KGT3_9PSEU|nr:hypothetical protein GCM10017567_45130 [Amycolatopsis bullii]
MTRGLVCFDVDGTLVPGTSSCAWVAAALGHEAELVAAEAAYAALSQREVALPVLVEVLGGAGGRGWLLHRPGRFAPERCAAVGDSRSDLPLFAAVGTSIALNATPAARAVATHVVDGRDLRAVIPVLAAQFSSV